MLSKEYEILIPFIEKPWLKATFRQIKEASGKRSNSYVYNILRKYVKQNLLSEETAGNVIPYKLNLANLKTQVYAGFVSEYIAWQKKHLPLDDLQNIALKCPASFFTLLVSGSYAKNRQKKDSDIDVVIICDNSVEPKKIYAELKHACETNIPPIHLYVFRKSEFLEMLINDEANYGKEISKNNIILLGGEQYFRIMSEAIKHGFTG